MKTKLNNSEEINDLIATIIEAYKGTGSGGNVNWKLAYKEHPEWEQALSHLTPSAVSVRATYIRQHGKSKRPKPAPQAPQAPQPATVEPTRKLNLFTPMPENERVVIEQVAREYGTKGYIKWDVVFAEHPEYQEVLKHVDRPLLRNRVGYMKKQLGLTRGSKPRGKHAKVQSNGLASKLPTTGAPGEIKFCPCCGENIAMWRHVSEVVKGL